MAYEYKKRVKVSLFYVGSVALLFATAVVLLQAFQVEPSEARCDRLTYPWSPALDVVKYHWETFENHQFSIKTPYFGFQATDQLEDIWNELLPKHPIAIPSSRIESLGHINSADDSAWIRDPNNSENLLALPEYTVQLGCLNFLRQLGYRSDKDFTYLKSFQGDDSLVWARADQCIERLRHAIMCWGDVGAVTLYYNGDTTTEEGSFRDVSFDFGTLHYCRNFETIDKWTKDNGLKGVVMDNLWWGGNNIA